MKPNSHREPAGLLALCAFAALLTGAALALLALRGTAILADLAAASRWMLCL